MSAEAELIVTAVPPPPEPPAITTQPESVTVIEGDAVTFTVEASGTGPLSYQWQFNGTDIAGATEASLTLDSARGADAGLYLVVVSSSAGSTVSAEAELIVTASEPENPDEPVTPGPLIANGSFELGEAGWSVFGNYVFAGAPFYVPTDGEFVAAFNGGQATPNGVFSQSFDTEAGQVYLLTFDSGVLAFNYYEQRMQVIVEADGAVLLSKTISMFGKGGGLTVWSPQTFVFVANGPSATLTFQDVSPITTSVDLLLDNVRVNVIAPVAITTQPASATVTVGEPVALSVEATGTGILSYQWRFNGNPIPGATASTYAMTMVQTSNAGTYDVVVSDGFTSAASEPAVLTVTRPMALNGFINGSFEEGYTGWIATGNQIVNGAQWYVGAEGDYLIAFNAGNRSPNGVLTQSFATVAGQTYILRCSIGVFAYNWYEQRMLVTVEGMNTLLSKTVSIFGAGGGSTRWAPQTFSFVADSATTTLTFSDLSPYTDALDLILDKVEVVPSN